MAGSHASALDTISTVRSRSLTALVYALPPSVCLTLARSPQVLLFLSSHWLIVCHRPLFRPLSTPPTYVFLNVLDISMGGGLSVVASFSGRSPIVEYY